VTTIVDAEKYPWEEVLIISDLGYSYSRKHDYVRVYGISHFGVLSYT
jgi:hypothetical protein